ncbi:MAG: hypothetical protein BWK79_17715 [Beggiatoa sp. IS2]|nr:MAG: hypothetical protein BWK79_17715 [Beggiatoa sp. IS2]
MPIYFKDKARFITDLIEKTDYTTAARECLILIEGGLRQIVLDTVSKLPDNDPDKQRIRGLEANYAKDGRTPSISKYGLGQSIKFIESVKFFEICKRVSNKEFKDLVNLEKLTQLRNQLFHINGWGTNREATRPEAEQLFSFLNNLAETFDLTGQNPRLVSLKQELSAKKLALKAAIYTKVSKYLKTLETQAIDDEAEETLEIIEEFLTDQRTIEDFSEFWQQFGEEARKMNYPEWRQKLQRGEIVLFLGSDIPDELVPALRKVLNYDDSESFPEICEYAELRDSRLGLARTIKTQVEKLSLVDSFKELYQLLATVPASLIVISVDCNTQLQDIFKEQRKKFVLFSPALEDAHLGKFILEYSDKTGTELVTSEQISDLKLLENGYSLIYKMRGCLSLNDYVPTKDCLILSEQDYFKFSRYLDKLVPDYLACHLHKRSLWFLGHHPYNWQNRLLTQAILDKRQGSLSYCVDNKINSLTQIYWEARGVKNYPLDVAEFMKNLR